MPVPATILSAVTHPGTLVFPENQGTIKTVAKLMGSLVASPHPTGVVWHRPEEPPATGLRILVTATGHGILYGEHGLRILYVDPGGTPLHECAWDTRGQGPSPLLRARLHLDWGQWVGLKTEGLINVARFDISKKLGWQWLTRENLHRMAAQFMGITPEEVAFFYDEKSLVLDPQGLVTLRHRKDAFYVLDDGTFARPRFMACMGAMHWGQIDFLPVVELFQSLLPGTGSAAFELIRGLYDDQNEGQMPRLLRYRGIPTYPSPQAFQLFSTYFQPQGPGGADPFPVFMDPARSGEVIWRPRPKTPRRHMDLARGLCVTVVDGAVQKVTLQNDPAALPFNRPRESGAAPGGRLAGARKNVLQLQDGARRDEIPIRPEWHVTKETLLPETRSGRDSTWRALFPDGVPELDPVRVYFAVPFYPDDGTVAGEVATQPLAMEQTLDYLGRAGIARGASKPLRAVLINNWDVVIAECLDSTHAMNHTVLYTRPEFALRQAQRAWDQAAAAGRLSNLQHMSFLQFERHREMAYAHTYGLIFSWLPFASYRRRAACEREVGSVSKALAPGGFAILVGPPWLDAACARASLSSVAADPIAETQGFRMHRAILPNARVNPEATLYLVKKA